MGVRQVADYLPKPYANEEAGRAANGGAYPPDLSLMTKARHDGQNYVFSLVTGYSDPPAGITMRGNLHYNKYFPGGAIAMARNLYDGIVTYDDGKAHRQAEHTYTACMCVRVCAGTPATTSQMAKDVTTFLSWAAEPEHDERKKLGIKAVLLCLGLTTFVFYIKRHRWSYLKTRKIIYKPNQPDLK